MLNEPSTAFCVDKHQSQESLLFPGSQKGLCCHIGQAHQKVISKSVLKWGVGRRRGSKECRKRIEKDGQREAGNPKAALDFASLIYFSK